MLEKIPEPVGRALRFARAGMEKVLFHGDETAEAPNCITVQSPAFADGGDIPIRYTADGAGVSPPLDWTGAPDGAVSLVLLVEDPDAPGLNPLVHCLAWDLPAGDGGLMEGELKSPGSEGRTHDLGRNAFLKAQYLPPDPPPGHGPHTYCFQVFALDSRLDLEGAPTRGQVVAAMKDHILGKGMVTGVYQRG